MTPSPNPYQQSLGITGWDAQGNPQFSTPRQQRAWMQAGRQYIADSTDQAGRIPGNIGVTQGTQPPSVSDVTGGTVGNGIPGLPGGTPAWLQALTNYGLPIAATLYGGLTQAGAYDAAGQTIANAYNQAGQGVAANAAAGGANVQNAGNAAASGITAAGQGAQAGVSPYTQAGAQAAGNLANMPDFAFNPDMLTQDPGYQFRLGQGAQGVQAQLAAEGLGDSGAALKELTQYGQNFASNEFQNAYNRAANTYGLNLARQQGLANQGLQASQYAGNAGLSAAQGAGQFGYQGALENADFGLQGSSYAGNAGAAAGTAQGSAQIGAGTAKAIMANQLANILLQNQQPGGLSLADLLSKLGGALGL